jgi:hypothetical protein
MRAESTVQKYEISTLIKDKNTILFLAFLNVVANTQKISYTYVKHSFAFPSLMEQTPSETIAFLFAWLMTILIVISLELSILLFVAKGVRWLGGLFAFMVFLLNLNYFTEPYLWINEITLNGPELVVKFGIDLILSALSPVVVFAFSELYVKENKAQTEEKQKEVQNDYERKISELTKENALNKQLLSKVEKQKSEAEEKNNRYNSFLIAYQQDRKQKKATIKRMVQEEKEIKSELLKYKSRFTCSGCGKEFETQNSLQGHKNKSNCK